MGSIQCPECKGEISSLAVSCPKCGASLAGYIAPGTSPRTSGGHTFLKIFFWIYAAFGLMGFIRLISAIKDKPSFFYFLASAVITFFLRDGYLPLRF